MSVLNGANEKGSPLLILGGLEIVFVQKPVKGWSAHADFSGGAADIAPISL